MFKSISIKAKLLLLVISSIIIISIAMLIESVVALEKTSDLVISDFKKDAYETKKRELENYVSLAIRTVNYYHERTEIKKVKKEVESYLKEQNAFLLSIIEGEYKKYNGKLSDYELKELIKNTVKSTRYGKNGYFWINDFDANIIMHPIKPSLDGKDLSNFEDKAGKKIFSEFARIAKTQGSGFVDYLWNKPGFDKPVLKVSYVSTFKQYNWVIGNGEYVDDVSAKLQKEAITAINNMKFGKSGYFWINDSNHVVIAHGSKPSLAGKDLTDLKDKKGKYLYREIVKTANENVQGGIVEYYWAKPGENEAIKKLSFVKKFEAWDWIIGTGAYVDDIEKRVLTMQEKTQDEINNTIFTTIVILLVIMILLSFLMSYISNRVIFNPLNEFQEGLLNFFKYINKENSSVKELNDSSDDEIGVMAKIINKNLLKTKSLIQQDEELINDVKRVVEEVKKGNLRLRVDKSTQNDTLQELKIIFNEMLDNVESNVDGDINNITDVLESFTNLDFTKEVKNPNGKVSKGLNKLAKIINKLLLDNLNNGSTLEENSNILSSNVRKLSTSSNTQAASLEETAAALEEITSTIISTTDSISEMAIYSQELKNSIASGQKLALSTVESMNEINSQTQAIASAITVIDQIAFQTNILSLNAAVEAATAGEAGKGFAVVAQEVRNLASRSAEAAKEIKNLVETATVKTNLGKQSADKMIAGYEELNSSILKTTETINDIASASKEQQVGIEQINDAITTLDQGTQENASVASETATIADSTSKMAKLIVDEANEANFIGKFDIKRTKTSINKEEYLVKSSAKSNNLQNKKVKQNKANEVDEWESF